MSIFVLDDFSRVKVSQVDKKDDDTDYINASFIDVRDEQFNSMHKHQLLVLFITCVLPLYFQGYNKNNAYIAAQGTAVHLWDIINLLYVILKQDHCLRQ